MEKILELRGITKRFGEFFAAREVSFDLNAGEVVALVGENGAGKSTLMNVLSGNYPSGTYEGQILVNGKEKRFKSAKDSKNAGIEMIHQEISLHLDLTVAENIFLGNLDNTYGLVNWKAVSAQAKKYLDMVQTDVSPSEEVRNLSTSQQQLLAIAKALACRPKILLFDEPTSALTQADAENLLNIIKTLKESGIACIYISHRLEEVMEIADRIVVLRDGQVISDKTRGEYTVENVIEDMVGRKLNEMYPKQQVPIGDVILRVEDLTVPHPYIAGKNIVENIGFEVRSGEILGVYGLVGSGRSETMNAIYGSLNKQSGNVFMNESPVSITKPKHAIANSIGLVTEDRKRSGIISSMNLRENMTLANLKAVSSSGFFQRQKESDISREYYDKLRVKAGGIEDNILNLSGGNQQKIVLSRWLMKDIKVLILDEPTRGVDVGAKVEIYNIITELVRTGIAIIMVSSELPELLGMCDRLLVLGKGRIRGIIPREEATQERVMRAATCVEEYGV